MPEPVTKLPGQTENFPAPAGPVKSGPPAATKERKTSTTTVDLDRALSWAASVEQASALGVIWAAVHERLAELEVKPNRRAAVSMPTAAEQPPTFNTASVVAAIRRCEDVADLQRLYAGLRQRIRQSKAR